MTEVLLYGLDQDGESAFTQVLRVTDRAALKDIALAKLAEFHAVEIWEGPLCVVRLRRKPAAAQDA